MKALFTAAVACVVCLCENVRSAPAAELDKDIIDAVRVVEDPDGSTNLRSSPSLKGEVTGKVASGSIIKVSEVKGDWAKIEPESGEGKPSYIHTSRLHKIDKWKQVSTHESKDKKTATAKHETMEVKVQTAPFVAADHKVAKNKEGAATVDGHRVWGRDGEVPTRTLSLTVTIGGKAVTIPAEATRDLYEPNMESFTLLTPPKDTGPVLVLMDNSDGAGAYCVIWTFSGGAYVGRTVFGRD